MYGSKLYAGLCSKIVGEVWTFWVADGRELEGTLGVVQDMELRAPRAGGIYSVKIGYPGSNHVNSSYGEAEVFRYRTDVGLFGAPGLAPGLGC